MKTGHCIFKSGHLGSKPANTFSTVLACFASPAPQLAGFDFGVAGFHFQSFPPLITVNRPLNWPSCRMD
jgi:hypothetical protein